MSVRLVFLLSLVAAGCGGSSPEVMAPPGLPPAQGPVVEAPPAAPVIACAEIPLPGSARIRWAQENLNALGFDCGAVDGLAGPRTEACVQAFQRTNRLPDSGYLDPETRRALACQL